jgi:hypothetical protein
VIWAQPVVLATKTEWPQKSTKGTKEDSRQKREGSRRYKTQKTADQIKENPQAVRISVGRTPIVSVGLLIGLFLICVFLRLSAAASSLLPSFVHLVLFCGHSPSVFWLASSRARPVTPD